jgi:hypothetical protein
MKKLYRYLTDRTIRYLALGSLLAILMMWGSYLVTTGILLGLLTLAGFAVIYNRIPFLKNIAIKFPGFFDISAAFLTYWMFGATVIGLIAAAIAGLGTSFLLDIAIENENEKINKRDAAFAEALA